MVKSYWWCSCTTCKEKDKFRRGLQVHRSTYYRHKADNTSSDSDNDTSSSEESSDINVVKSHLSNKQLVDYTAENESFQESLDKDDKDAADCINNNQDDLFQENWDENTFEYADEDNNKYPIDSMDRTSS